MAIRTRKFSVEAQKMVSLVTRSEYLYGFTSNPYTNTFIDFLLDRPIQSANDLNLSNADNLALHVLWAVQKDNKEIFEKDYQQICRRHPRRESDWLYNDVLLFSLTMGILKFHASPDWLIQTLEVRRQYANEEKELISQTLLDALNGNFNNKGSYLPLILVVQHILELPIEDSEQVNAAYQALIQQTFPIYGSFFLNAISLRALDVIVLSKGLLNWKHQQQTQKFIGIFKRRVHLLSNLLWAIVMLAAIAVTVWYIYYLWPFKSQQANQLNFHLNILSLFGVVAPIPLALRFRNRIVHFFERWISFFWGYKFPQILTEEGTE